MSEVVMYIIINKEVKMSKGKCVAQGAHVACKAVLAAKCSPILTTIGYLERWLSGSYAKIILKASVYEMKELLKMSQNWVQVIDEGRTEIPHGTLTAIAHTPYDKEQMNKDYPILSKLSML